MKTRLGFVSNSSSSSFVINRDSITSEQFSKIFEITDESWNKGIDSWEIKFDGKEISGFTWMDNFDMNKYLAALGIDARLITWSD